MKIGILYICTGKYRIFWDDFYKSCEQYFMTDYERHYFVFTDGTIPTYNNPNVKVIYQEKLDWPFATLKRFNMFTRAERELSEMDYLFFFNANLVLMKNIGSEILPDVNQELTVALHPGFYDKEVKTDDSITYERNTESNAYISYGQGNYYVAGGFNGGTSTKFLKMTSELNTLIEDDLNKGIIAVWHDESHLNRYILDKKVKVLHPGYIYPEDWNLPFEMLMKIRDKNKYGGHDALRDVKKRTSFSTFLKKIFRKK